MKVLISGIAGHMGREVLAQLTGETVCGVDPAGGETIGVPCAPSFDRADPDVDCIIDFSHHSNTETLLAFAVKHRLPLVLATTGQTEEEKEKIFAAAKQIPLFFAANYSIGVVLLIELAKKAAAALPEAEIEIVEKHHDRKIDAPSGTALALAEALRQVRPKAFNVLGRHGAGKRTKDEIGIHSLRMGNLAGEHEVILATPYQTLTLKHEAHSRALFAEGAVAAARFLCGKPAGLYTMNDLISI